MLFEFYFEKKRKENTMASKSVPFSSNKTKFFIWFYADVKYENRSYGEYFETMSGNVQVTADVRRMLANGNGEESREM